MHLYLAPNGDVRSCCQAQWPVGSLPFERLRDVWRGVRRRELVAALAADDFSLGCQACADEIALEGRAASYAAMFDAEQDPGPDGWPSFIEFNLSNRCNLRCVQCGPELSSAIRATTGLPPVTGVYGDDFFEDLREFLPHLSRAQFAGGEPFLAAENFRVWDLVAELAPGLDVTVVTNATHLTPKVRDVLERVPMSIVVSLDGASSSTFDAIRVGASFDEVMANLDWLVAYARRVGTRLSLNHCLMVQNVHEFPDLLLLAEGRGLAVQVSVVRGPADCALGMLAPDQLEDVLVALAGRDDEMAGRLELNLPVWRRELARIATWASRPAETSDAFERGWYTRDDRIEMFRRPGRPVDAAAVRESLAEVLPGSTVYELRLATDQTVLEDPDGFGELLGLLPGGAVGLVLPDLAPYGAQRFGPPLDVEVVVDDDDRVEVRTDYRSVASRSVMFPVRNDDGWTVAVTVLVAVGPEGPPAGQPQ